MIENNNIILPTSGTYGILNFTITYVSYMYN